MKPFEIAQPYTVNEQRDNSAYSKRIDERNAVDDFKFKDDELFTEKEIKAYKDDLKTIKHRPIDFTAEVKRTAKLLNDFRLSKRI